MTKAKAIYILLRCNKLRTRANKIVLESIETLSNICDDGKEQAMDDLKSATEMIVGIDDVQIDAEFALEFDCQTALLN